MQEAMTNETRSASRRDWHKGQLAAAQDDDALLAWQAVSLLTGYGRTSIYDKVKEGRFPKPIKLGLRAVRWRAGDVRAWLRTVGQQQEAAA